MSKSHIENPDKTITFTNPAKPEDNSIDNELPYQNDDPALPEKSGIRTASKVSNHPKNVSSHTAREKHHY